MSVAARAASPVPLAACQACSRAVQWLQLAAPPTGSRNCRVQSRIWGRTVPARTQRQGRTLLASAAAGGAETPARALPAGGLGAWPKTARVALRTGAYITALGLAVLVAPVATFGLLFDASTVPQGWIRVGGVLMTLFGSYYLGAALDDAEERYPRHFYATTILGRLALSAAFAVLVGTRQCPPALLWLAAANAASSILLWRAAAQRAGAAAPPQ